MAPTSRPARPRTRPAATRRRVHVLAVDVGSSGARAAVVGDDGVEGDVDAIDYAISYGADGAAELAPSLMLETVATVIDRALGSARAAGTQIAAVAMDTMWHSVCGIDRAGAPTFPVLTWADRRATAWALRLRQRIDDLGQHRRTGARLHPMYLPAKLAWLAAERPEAFAATSRFLSPGEFLYATFFGTATTSISMASATGLFDQGRLTWDEEILSAIALDHSRLPPISDEPATSLTGPWAKRWPELATVPWFPAIGDGVASSIGSGCVDATRLALTLGTSGALRVLFKSRRPRIDDGLWCYRGDAETVAMGGALNDGGNLVAWVRSRFRLANLARAEQELLGRLPGAHHLTMLPFLAGERSPGWAAAATGALVGLTQATTPLDILHAALEAVALRFLLVHRIIDDALPGEKEVVATGGAFLASPAWRQILTDALGVPILACEVNESSLRGSALVGLARAGAISGVGAVPAPLGTRIEPDPARHRRYGELLEDQQALYRRLITED